MTDAIDTAANDQSFAALFDALRWDERADPQMRLHRLRQSQEKARAATEQYAEQLDRLYDEVERSGHNADWLVQAAEIVRQREKAEQEKLRPGIEALKEKLVARRGRDDSEARRIAEDSIAIAERWLALQAALYRKLAHLADDRRAAAEKIRYARPIAGEIDHEALSREFMARFPKIRAALAK